jgi:hypothetical protein
MSENILCCGSERASEDIVNKRTHGNHKSWAYRRNEHRINSETQIALKRKHTYSSEKDGANIHSEASHENHPLSRYHNRSPRIFSPSNPTISPPPKFPNFNSRLPERPPQWLSPLTSSLTKASNSGFLVVLNTVETYYHRSPQNCHT